MVERSWLPRSSTLGSRRITRCFKVHGDDGTCYILRNDVAAARWELSIFDRTDAIG